MMTASTNTWYRYVQLCDDFLDRLQIELGGRNDEAVRALSAVILTSPENRVDALPDDFFRLEDRLSLCVCFQRFRMQEAECEANSSASACLSRST